MDLHRLDPQDLDAILDTLREFAEREMPFERLLEWDREDVCPEELIRRMLSDEVGLHLVFIPAEYDGLGGGAYDVYRLSCEFGKIDLGVATSMLGVALGIDPIRVGCTDEQKQNWMTRVANEGLIVAYCVTEPEAGSNVENLKTTAVRVCDGDGAVTHYKLNGVKQFITNGSIGDLFTVLARTEAGPTFFVVEKGTPGLSHGKQEEKHGIRLSNTTQVILEDVVIPAANLVGAEEGHGLKQANEVFGFTRLMVAAFGLGGGLAAHERAIAYAKERKQFGAPLTEKQGYTHKLLVPHSVKLAAAKAYIEYVADLLDSGDIHRQVEGSVAKYFATEAGSASAEAAIQALGGYGYCAEYQVEKIKRDTRILTIYEGTSEIQQNIIGVFRMRENVRAKGGFYNDLADKVVGLEDVNGHLVAKAARFLSECTMAAVKGKMLRQQHCIMELATAMADVETAVALCESAAKDGSELIAAQARVWAAEVAVSVPTRLMKLFTGSGLFDDEALAQLSAHADIPGAIAAQSGVLADMDRIAAIITA